jgi:hypothetical protein
VRLGWSQALRRQARGRVCCDALSPQSLREALTLATGDGPQRYAQMRAHCDEGERKVPRSSNRQSWNISEPRGAPRQVEDT